MNNNSNDFKLVNQSFDLLRNNMRKNGRKIFQQILKNYFYSTRPKKITLRCIFCSSLADTREHIIPAWLHRQSVNQYFTSTINGIEFDFKKVTVPACKACNNEILSSIERYLVLWLNKIGIVDSPITNRDTDILIRWLEIIDYKFQVMNFIQRFIVFKGAPFDPKFAKIPLGILRKDVDPSRMLKQLERSIRRLGIADKRSRYHALLQYHRIQNSNDEVFLHGMGNFIALEIARHRVAFFYFYERKFSNHMEVHTAMAEILRKA